MARHLLQASVQAAASVPRVPGCRGKARSPDHVALDLPPLSVAGPVVSKGDAHPVARLHTPVAVSPRHPHHRSPSGSPAPADPNAPTWQGVRTGDGQAAARHLRAHSGGGAVTPQLHSNGIA